MRRSRYVLLGCLVLVGIFVAERALGRAPRPAPNPARVEAAPGQRIQVAILLDVSGSMSGLINQTRTELWSLVTELTKARRDGKRARFEIALYTYGRTDHPEQGYLQRMLPFTNDLDALSEQLFAEQPAGGEEYCGEVIQAATRDLAWSDNPDDLKVMFIAGNESFRQGPVDAMEAIRAAGAKGITVNTIHCGRSEVGMSDGWRDAAVAANGRYMFIDHNEAVVEVVAPQDAALAELSRRLNTTYVPYGALGMAGVARQQAQDVNSASISVSNSAARAIAKSGAEQCNGLDDDCDSSYDNAGWDLVDAQRKNAISISQMADADLPPALRGKSSVEREQWVAERQAERTRIQDEIRRLAAERTAFLEQARRTGAGGHTADQAMIEAVHEQAARVRLSFAEKK